MPLAAKMADEPFKLLIMDSITGNLRVDFCGRGELAERQQKLGQLMQRLRKVGRPSCRAAGRCAVEVGRCGGASRLRAHPLPAPCHRRSQRSTTWQCSSPTRRAAWGLWTRVDTASRLLLAGTSMSWLGLLVTYGSRPSMHALLQVISDPSGGAMFVADPKKPGEQS